MMKSAVVVACVGVLCLAIASDSAAEPIRVTSGSLVFPEPNQLQSGPMSLSGTRGFSLTGAVDTGENNLGPFPTCFPCEPSTTLDLGGHVSGSGFFDTDVTFDGRTFPNVNSGFESADLVLGFSGSVALPALGESPIVLTAPFALVESRLRVDGNAVPIRGGGMVTLRLQPRFGIWEFQDIRYDFVSTPTPEPGTLSLIGAALAGVALRVRQRTGHWIARA